MLPSQRKAIQKLQTLLRQYRVTATPRTDPSKGDVWEIEQDGEVSTLPLPGAVEQGQSVNSWGV